MGQLQRYRSERLVGGSAPRNEPVLAGRVCVAVGAFSAAVSA